MSKPFVFFLGAMFGMSTLVAFMYWDATREPLRSPAPAGYYRSVA